MGISQLAERLLTQVDRLAGCWLDWRTEQRVGQVPELADLHLHRAGLGPNGKFEITLLDKGEGIAMFAQEAAAVLEGVGAENYFQFDILPRLDRGQRAVRLTSQWATGMSPATRAAALEAALKQAREAIEAHRTELSNELVAELLATLEPDYRRWWEAKP